MRIGIETQTLLKAAKETAKALPTRSNLPILQHFLVEVTENGEMILKSTNLDFSIVESVTVTELEGHGMFTLPGKTFLEVLSNITEPYIELISNDGTTTLKTPKGNHYEFIGLSPEDFPEISYPEGESEIVFLRELVLEGVDYVGFCVSKDDLRAFLTGIYWHVFDGELRFVASDAHRLGLFGIKGDYPSDFEAIVSPQVFDFLKNRDDEDVVIRTSKELIEFSFPNARLVARVIEGPYPEYQNVLPEIPGKGVLRINRDEISGALKRLMVFTESPSYATVWTLEGDKITVKASSPDSGEAEETLMGDYTGEPMKIALNASFLLDIIKKIRSFEIEMHFYDPLRAILIRPTEIDENQDLLYIVMPVRLAEEEFEEIEEE